MSPSRRRIDIDGLAYGVIDSPQPPDSMAPVILLVHGIDMSYRYRRLRDAARVSRFIDIPHHHHVVQCSAPRAVDSAILFHTAATWPDAAAPYAAVDGEGAPSIL